MNFETGLVKFLRIRLKCNAQFINIGMPVTSGKFFFIEHTKLFGVYSVCTTYVHICLINFMEHFMVPFIHLNTCQAFLVYTRVTNGKGYKHKI